ncbi:MAG: helix-turn-helix domain-containing protein [Pseudomonadota bacterium]
MTLNRDDQTGTFTSPTAISADETFLSYRQVGRLLGISKSTIKRLNLPRHKIGRQVRFRKSDVEAYLEANQRGGQTDNIEESASGERLEAFAKQLLALEPQELLWFAGRLNIAFEESEEASWSKPIPFDRSRCPLTAAMAALEHTFLNALTDVDRRYFINSVNNISYGYEISNGRPLDDQDMAEIARHVATQLTEPFICDCCRSKVEHSKVVLQ